jgi:hypothetical protein
VLRLRVAAIFLSLFQAFGGRYLMHYDGALAEHWKAKHGDVLNISASYGGSGKQARAIIDVLEVDVETLVLAADITLPFVLIHIAGFFFKLLQFRLCLFHALGGNPE